MQAFLKIKISLTTIPIVGNVVSVDCANFLNAFTRDKDLTFVFFCKDPARHGRLLCANTKTKTRAVKAYKFFYEGKQ